MSLISQKKRNSSIELYRIIATFAVLIVHFNGWFVNMPNKLDMSQLSSFRLSQAIIESASCICVNMFLLISGYFGIRLKGSSVLKICLLLLFIYIPFDFFNALLTTGDFYLRNLKGGFFMMSRSGYFVQCYLMLMFFSPILNAFVEKYGKRVLPWIIALMLIEAWFGNFKSIDCLGFGYGYHIMHFILMYMIARCLYMYKDYLLLIKKMYFVIGFVLCTIIIFFQYAIGIAWAFKYSNPICILSAICSFLPFIYYNYYIPLINWIASSTFAVYIIQVTSPAYSYLVKIDNYLLETHSYAIYLIASFGVMLVFFLLCVIYDKMCNFFINPIVSLYRRKFDEKFQYC